MRNEILRMESVTFYQKNILQLDNFNLNIYRGEIFGLLSVNSYGLHSLIHLLKYNLAIEEGYIYYDGELINSRYQKKKNSNKIALIYNGNSLVEGLTVADNVFVLRKGFKKRIINTAILQEQLAPFLKDIEVEIKADQYVMNLTAFERIIVELLKGIVAGNKLIILVRTHSLLNKSELEIINRIVLRYSEKGFTFVFLELHYNDMSSICDRIAFMSYGRIIKVFDEYEIKNNIDIQMNFNDNKISKDNFNKKDEKSDKKTLILNFKYENIVDFKINLSEKECTVVQFLNNDIYNIFVRDFLINKSSAVCSIVLSGISQYKSGNRKIGVINEYCTQTMVFDKMSYLDNLCFNLDHRVNNVWINNKVKKSIFNEYSKMLGKDVFKKNISELSESQKIKLIYSRLLLQKPEILFCIQPFSGADNKLRLLIREQIKRFIKIGITVVIITSNISDDFKFCDNYICVKKDNTIQYFSRDEIKKINF